MRLLLLGHVLLARHYSGNSDVRFCTQLSLTQISASNRGLYS